MPDSREDNPADGVPMTLAEAAELRDSLTELINEAGGHALAEATRPVPRCGVCGAAGTALTAGCPDGGWRCADRLACAAGAAS